MSNIKAQNNVEKTKQQVQLVKGLFTPSEATHIVNVLIEQKVNFHKLQKLKLCEDFEDSITIYEDNRIEELTTEKKIAKDYINIAKKEGYSVAINGTLNISFLKL